MTIETVKDIIQSVANQALYDYAGANLPGTFLATDLPDESFLTSFSNFPLVVLNYPIRFTEDYAEKTANTKIKIRVLLQDRLDSNSAEYDQLLYEAYKITQYVCRALTNSAVEYPSGIRDSLYVGNVEFEPIKKKDSAIVSGYEVSFSFDYPLDCEPIPFDPDPLGGAFLLLEGGGYIRLETTRGRISLEPI